MANADITAPPPLRTTTAKPKMTPYYALLIIALLAMITACIILYAEVQRLKKEKGGAWVDRPAATAVVDGREFEGVAVV